MAQEPINKEKLQRDLGKKFDEADKDKRGYINDKELEGLLLKSGYKTTPDERKKLIAKMDKSKDGKISKEEFVNALLDSMDPVKQEEAMLRRTFDYIDKDKSGSIEKEELMALFKAVGKTLSEEQATAMMKHLDKDNSGKVEFEEFVASYTSSKKKMK